MKYIDSEKLIAEIEKWSDGKLTLSLLVEIKGIITSLQQEQPEVDLEKVLSGFTGYYAHENSGEYPSAIEIACYFYKLGLNARKDE
jgi:hypothetical protein